MNFSELHEWAEALHLCKETGNCTDIIGSILKNETGYGMTHWMDFCSNGEMYSWLIAFLAVYLPLGLPFTFLGTFFNEMIFFVYIFCLLLQFYLNQIVRYLWGFQMRPHPHCNSSLGMPSIEAQFLFSFITYLGLVLFFIHLREERLKLSKSLSSRYKPLSISWYMWIMLWLSVFVIPIGLIVTGNNSVLQVTIGGLVGSVSTAIYIILVYCFWEEDFPRMERIWVFKKIGVKDTIFQNMEETDLTL